MQPSPKRLILDLLSTMNGRPMPVRALVAAAEVFGISAESLRVALVRLLERGTIERNERGLYAIAASGQAVQQHVVAWNRFSERLVPWRGAWVGVHTASLTRTDRSRLRRRERALNFLGFRELESGLWLRPDNLGGGVASVRRQLTELGLDEAALVFAIHQLDPLTEERARSLWNAEKLKRDYRQMRVRLERSAAQLSQLTSRQAMVESFLVGGEAIRQIALDPLLPEPIVSTRERAALIDAMRRYDRLGRDRWRPFMREYGAPQPRSPLNPQAARPLEEAMSGVWT